MKIADITKRKLPTFARDENPSGRSRGSTIAAAASKGEVRCDHHWTPNRGLHDFGYHCDLCGCDPGGMTRAERSEVNIAKIARKVVSIEIMPASVGYFFFGEQGAMFGVIASIIATLMLLAGGRSFGSLFFFFKN